MPPLTPLRPKSTPISTPSFATTTLTINLPCALCFPPSSTYRNSPGDYPAALKTVDALRDLEEKPAAKLTTGLFARARLQAAIDTQSTSGPAYEQAFRKHYREAIDPLPWDVVQDDIKASYAGSRVYTKSAAIGQVKTELDPAVQKSGALDNPEAWDLISTRNRSVSPSRWALLAAKS